MLPCYKIVIPDKESFFGYYYRYSVKAMHHPNPPVYSRDGRYLLDSIDLYPCCAVKKDTGEEVLLRDAFLCPQTDIYDISNINICDRDIITFVFESQINLYGVVYLNRWSAQYHIYLPVEQETVPLANFKCKVVGNLGNYEDAKKYFDMSRDDYKWFLSYLFYISDGYYSEVAWSPHSGGQRDSGSLRKVDKKVQYYEDRYPKMWNVVQYPDGTGRIYDDKVATPSFVFKSWQEVEERVFELLKPLYYPLTKEDIDKYVFPQVLMAPSKNTTNYDTIFLGDKLYLQSDTNIFGYLHYLPKEGSFMVEIPEEVRVRDEIFNGFMPLFDVESYYLPCKFTQDYKKFPIIYNDRDENAPVFLWYTERMLQWALKDMESTKNIKNTKKKEEYKEKRRT